VGEIDYLQPLVPETHPSAHQLPATVGAAPLLAAHHRSYGCGIGDAAVEAQLAGYAAHERLIECFDLCNITPANWLYVTLQPRIHRFAPALEPRI
jgi:hypothetical protein